MEIGLTVSGDEVERIDRQLPDDVTRLRHERGEVYFEDLFRFRWNVTPAGTWFVSNAMIDRRWLDL